MEKGTSYVDTEEYLELRRINDGIKNKNWICFRSSYGERYYFCTVNKAIKKCHELNKELNDKFTEVDHERTKLQNTNISLESKLIKLNEGIDNLAYDKLIIYMASLTIRQFKRWRKKHSKNQYHERTKKSQKNI